MRRLISIVMSVLMAVSMLTVAAMPAFAADAVSSPGGDVQYDTLQDGMVRPTVNGESSQDVVYDFSDVDPNEVTFVYEGEGTLLDWENNLESLGLVSGVDFVATINEDGSYTITFMTQEAIAEWNDGNVEVNAVVDFGEDGTTEVPAETDTEETTKKNESAKSPSTGICAAAAASGIAAAGAGLAVLAASRKKDAE